jgi:putative CocE/NonD family hydrolase
LRVSDLPNTAWRVLPQAYLDKRSTPFAGSKIPLSSYVTMRDGVRLAVDVYLPQSDGAPPKGKRFPTIVIFTPYYRRFKLRDGAPDSAEPSPNAGRYRDFFVPRGYAVVVVDVRGTGASFGTREAFRSPEERDDYKEIVDWILAQGWSDGRVGATGVSYVGAACDFVASTGHPAIKAIAPLFSVWDTYSDHYYPGGLLLNQLAKTYDELLVALDHDRRDLLTNFAYYKEPNLAGPMPVDGDDGTLVRAAVKEHLGNFHMTDFIREFPFKDDALPYDKSFTSASFSPYKYAAGIREDVAVYSVSGWMDGVGYTNGAISRFLTLPNPKKHLLIGPWDHGARMNVSLFRAQPESQFPMLAELLRFFDHYLMETESGLDQESPVHYFTMAEERWHDAAQWPPRPDEKRLFLAPNAQLGDSAGSDGADSFKADFSLGTGEKTRYGRLAALDVRDYYTDWHGRDAAMLTYTSAPLDADMELTGHPIITLHLSADQGDAAVHVYLEDVTPDGTCRYVTEGMLRALHRREATAPHYHQVVGPYRSFARRDAQPLVPGEPAILRFSLLPTSWRFKAGHRLRIAIAGADKDNYAQVPHGRPPLISIRRGSARPSHIVLPLAAADKQA